MESRWKTFLTSLSIEKFEFVLRSIYGKDRWVLQIGPKSKGFYNDATTQIGANVKGPTVRDRIISELRAKLNILLHNIIMIMQIAPAKQMPILIVILIHQTLKLL